jgi:hypothetical protein
MNLQLTMSLESKQVIKKWPYHYREQIFVDSCKVIHNLYEEIINVVDGL